MLKRLFFLSFLPFFCQAEDLPAPVKAIEKQGITIIKPFEAPGGVKGWLGKYQDMGVAIYLTPDGKHAISGYMYDENGNNLSEQLYAGRPGDVEENGGRQLATGREKGGADHSVCLCRSLLPVLPAILATGASVGRVRQSTDSHAVGWRHQTRKPGNGRRNSRHPGSGENLA